MPVPAPVKRIDATLHSAMKGRIGPVLHAGCPAMFDRIVMDIIEMARVVLFVANGMLPEATLPDSSFPSLCPDRGTVLDRNDSSHEANLYRLPAIGKIGIARRQGPHAMHMIRQHYPAVDMQRPLQARGTHSFPQRIDMAHQKIRTSFQQIDRNKIGAARDAATSVIRHRCLPVRNGGDGGTAARSALRGFPYRFGSYSIRGYGSISKYYLKLLQRLRQQIR